MQPQIFTTKTAPPSPWWTWLTAIAAINKNYYPNLTKRILIVNAPWALRGLLKLPLIPAESRAKCRFVRARVRRTEGGADRDTDSAGGSQSQEYVDDFVSPALLPACLGGTCAYQIDGFRLEDV